MAKRPTFRYNRLLRYAAISLIPLLILCMLIIRQSREWALSITRQNTVDMLDKNADLIDQQLRSFTESMYLLMSDPQLIELLVSTGYEKPASFRRAQYDFPSLCTQYFYSVDFIESMYIASKDYMFCYVNKSGLPTIFDADKISFGDDIRAARGQMVWFPTYNLVDAFDLRKTHIAFYPQCSVFTVGMEMELRYVIKSAVYDYSGKKEKPIIFLNIYPSLFDRYLASEQLLAETGYVIYDEQRRLVYASDDNIKHLIGRIPSGEGNKSTMSTITGERGGNLLVYSRPLSSTGWTIASLTSMKAAYNYFDYNIGLISFLVILSTILCVGVIVRVSTRSIGRPLHILADGLGETALGNFAHRICDYRHPDYAETFSAYNSMNQRIERLIKENYEIKLSEKNLEIQLINLQFNPHFLYNTLNVINLMALELGQDDISDMICKLSHMMRYSVKTPSVAVPFQEEIQYIDAYTALMQLRAGHPFAYEKEIDPEILSLIIPKFLLQPFVENSILHGFSRRSGQYKLRISGRILGEDVFLTIEDNGVGMQAEQIETMWQKDVGGLGIANTRERILMYYGEQYGISIESKLGAGTCVTLHIARTMRPTEAAPADSSSPPAPGVLSR
jgi:two-component system sensor histidine kinase YesM